MRGLPPYCEHVNAMYVPRSWQRASVVHSTQTLSATEQTPVSQSLDDMQATQVFVATSHTGRSLSVQSAEDEQNTHLPRLHEVLPSALFCERARHVKSRSFPSSRRHARIVQQPARERSGSTRWETYRAHVIRPAEHPNFVPKLIKVLADRLRQEPSVGVRGVRGVRGVVVVFDFLLLDLEGQPGKQEPS